MTDNADNSAVYSRIAAVVNKKNSFSICLPQNATLDTAAAGLALYMGLSKLGKQVSIACAGDLSDKSNVIGIDKIQKNLGSGGDDLVISFPYTDGAIDKVTYNIEGNTFNLLIMPREGQERIDPSQVKYNYTGAKVDAIITLDTPALNSLGALFSANQDQFGGRDIINIDRHLTNGRYGTINLVEKSVSSTSEIVLQLLTSLNAELDRDMATNLYAGIASATNNFSSYSVNAQTFEAGAYLMKLGAVKKQAPRPQAFGQSTGAFGQGIPPQTRFTPQPQAQTQPFGQPVGQSFRPASQFPSVLSTQSGSVGQSWQPPLRPAPQAGFQSQAQPVTPAPTKESQTFDQSQVEARDATGQEGDSIEGKKTPKEWLKPKIFKGSNLV